MTDNYVTLDDLAEVLMLTSPDPKADERGHEYWHEKAQRFVDRNGWDAAKDRVDRFEKAVSARAHQDALDAQGEPDY